jgi:hypothetical protein
MSPLSSPAPAFLRAAQLARYLGLSRAHFYRHMKGKLAGYRAGGRVILYSVREAEALIRNGGRR